MAGGSATDINRARFDNSSYRASTVCVQSESPCALDTSLQPRECCVSNRVPISFLDSIQSSSSQRPNCTSCSQINQAPISPYFAAHTAAPQRKPSILDKVTPSYHIHKTARKTSILDSFTPSYHIHKPTRKTSILDSFPPSYHLHNRSEIYHLHP